MRPKRISLALLLTALFSLPLFGEDATTMQICGGLAKALAMDGFASKLSLGNAIAREDLILGKSGAKMLDAFDAAVSTHNLVALEGPVVVEFLETWAQQSAQIEGTQQLESTLDNTRSKLRPTIRRARSVAMALMLSLVGLTSSVFYFHHDTATTIFSISTVIGMGMLIKASRQISREASGIVRVLDRGVSALTDEHQSRASQSLAMDWRMDLAGTFEEPRTAAFELLDLKSTMGIFLSKRRSNGQPILLILMPKPKA